MAGTSQGYADRDNHRRRSETASVTVLLQRILDTGHVAHEIRATDQSVYRKVGKLAPSRAPELAREADALIAYDACACDGYCGYEWFSGDAFAEAGNPRIKPVKNTLRHALSEYRDDAGRPLILAEGGVHWGGLLADRPRR